MNELIDNYNAWLDTYRTNKYNIWFRVILSNGQEIYLKDYKQWLTDLKNYCYQNDLKIDIIKLQYRSNIVEIDTKNTDGVYLVKSVLGHFGDNIRQTITVGKINGGTVSKTVWMTPELIQRIEENDTLDNCFKEAIIKNYDR